MARGGVGGGKDRREINLGDRFFGGLFLTRVDGIGLGKPFTLGVIAVAHGVQLVGRPARQHEHQERAANRANRLGQCHRVKHGSPVMGRD